MFALITLLLTCQAPAVTPTAPPRVATAPLDRAQDPVLLDLGPDLAVTEDDYRAYLRAAIGSARLEDLVFDRLLDRAWRTLEPTELPSALRAVATDPGAAARAVDEQLRGQFGAGLDGYPRYLRNVGRTDSEERASRAAQVRRDWQIHALVAMRRRVDEASMTRAFHEHFGKDGIAVRAEHVWAPFHDDHGHAAPHAPTDAEREASRQRVLARVAPLRARGSDLGLEAIGGETLREGFEQIFGDEFAAAVRGLAVGGLSAPIASRRGMHVVRVIEKVVTPRARVADRLPDLVRSAPPSLAETRALREELLEAHGVPAAIERHLAK